VAGIVVFINIHQFINSSIQQFFVRRSRAAVALAKEQALAKKDSN